MDVVVERLGQNLDLDLDLEHIRRQNADSATDAFIKITQHKIIRYRNKLGNCILIFQN